MGRSHPLLALAMLLFVVLLVAVTGCGGDTDAGTSPSETYGVETAAPDTVETAAPDAESDAVPWDEADAYLGESVTVEGRVVSTFYADTESGEPTFLNVGRDYPDPGRFTVVIWGDDRSAFPDAPEYLYEGKTNPRHRRGIHLRGSSADGDLLARRD